MLVSAFQSRTARRRDDALGRDGDLLDNPRLTDGMRESRQMNANEAVASTLFLGHNGDWWDWWMLFH